MSTYRVEISLTHTHADDAYALGEAKWLHDVALNRIAVAQHVYPDTALEETPWSRVVNVETGETVHAAFLNRDGVVVEGEPGDEPEPGEPTGDVQPFAVGEDVVVGDEREYHGVVYRCTMAHTTAAHWSPDVATTLWTPA